MNNIAVVIPYFGKFKPSIVLFLESCNRNPDIDWHIFTDCEIPSHISLNGNILWHYSNLDEIHNLSEQKLGCPITLNRVYKLCDMKPMYGLIFQDYLDGYDYWGFGDTDVIYGNVMEYLRKIRYSQYDKINWMGHLCFMRNLPEINGIAMTEIPGTISPKEVLKDENNNGYDERDFNIKCIQSGVKLYNDQWAADIDIFYWRMRCADLKTFHWLLDTKEIKYAPKNYTMQLFAVAEGRVFRYYIAGKKVFKDEFAYIHFRKEVPMKFQDTERNTFLISRGGFISVEKADLEEVSSLQKLIKEYNSQETPFQECKTFLYQYYRKISGKRGW